RAWRSIAARARRRMPGAPRRRRRRYSSHPGRESGDGLSPTRRDASARRPGRAPRLFAGGARSPAAPQRARRERVPRARRSDPAGPIGARTHSEVGLRSSKTVWLQQLVEYDFGCAPVTRNGGILVREEPVAARRAAARPHGGARESSRIRAERARLSIVIWGPIA